MFHTAFASRLILALIAIFFCTAFLIRCSPEESDTAQTEKQEQGPKRAMANTPELADAMGQLQRYTHKYALAAQAKNHELATFYFHEVRAAVDGIKKNIPGYEGYDIKRFMNMFLDPTLEPVETALANRNWEQVKERTIEMVDACNSCHNATSHGFIQVKPGFNNNPFNQEFSVPE